MTPADEMREWGLSFGNATYFIHHHVSVYDATPGTSRWVPLHLWPCQQQGIRDILSNRLIAMLKARQLGCTSFVLGLVLWIMLFRPAATVLLFSRSDDDAIDLLDFRLKGMYQRLPGWAKCASITLDNKHEWELSNGSRAFAFGTIGGDSYTATIAVIDEADLIPHLEKLMGSVKPTTDAGGKLVLLSRPDKSKPESPFKKIYLAATKAGSAWKPIFYPWHARPGRDQDWYEAAKKEIFERTGAFDELYEQYPATAAEALAPAQLDKRIPYQWIHQCYSECPLLNAETVRLAGLQPPPAIPGLTLYRAPVRYRQATPVSAEAGPHRYVFGVDTAEGNPTSDDSAATVLDVENGEEVAKLQGKFEPKVFGQYLIKLAQWYNNAALMIERNNHGHAVIMWVGEHSNLRRMGGHDGAVGWLSSSKGKAILYDDCADVFKNKETKLHSFESHNQLASIEGATLRAPEGQHDDLADSYALACCGMIRIHKVMQSDDDDVFTVGTRRNTLG